MTTKLCENLRELRIAHKFTFKKLEESMKIHGCDVSASTLQRYEAGIIPNVPYDSIIALSEIYQVSPCALMGWDRAPLLNRAESELLYDFRKLNTAGQKAAAKVVKSFTSDPDYAIQTESEAEPSTKKAVSSSA